MATSSTPGFNKGGTMSLRSGKVIDKNLNQNKKLVGFIQKFSNNPNSRGIQAGDIVKLAEDYFAFRNGNERIIVIHLAKDGVGGSYIDVDANNHEENVKIHDLKAFMSDEDTYREHRGYPLSFMQPLNDYRNRDPEGFRTHLGPLISPTINYSPSPFVQPANVGIIDSNTPVDRRKYSRRQSINVQAPTTMTPLTQNLPSTPLSANPIPMQNLNTPNTPIQIQQPNHQMSAIITPGVNNVPTLQGLNRNSGSGGGSSGPIIIPPRGRPPLPKGPYKVSPARRILVKVPNDPNNGQPNAADKGPGQGKKRKIGIIGAVTSGVIAGIAGVTHMTTTLDNETKALLRTIVKEAPQLISQFVNSYKSGKSTGIGNSSGVVFQGPVNNPAKLANPDPLGLVNLNNDPTGYNRIHGLTVSQQVMNPALSDETQINRVLVPHTVSTTQNSNAMVRTRQRTRPINNPNPNNVAVNVGNNGQVVPYGAVVPFSGQGNRIDGGLVPNPPEDPSEGPSTGPPLIGPPGHEPDTEINPTKDQNMIRQIQMRDNNIALHGDGDYANTQVDISLMGVGNIKIQYVPIHWKLCKYFLNGNDFGELGTYFSEHNTWNKKGLEYVKGKDPSETYQKNVNIVNRMSTVWELENPKYTGENKDKCIREHLEFCALIAAYNRFCDKTAANYNSETSKGSKGSETATTESSGADGMNTTEVAKRMRVSMSGVSSSLGLGTLGRLIDEKSRRTFDGSEIAEEKMSTYSSETVPVYPKLPVSRIAIGTPGLNSGKKFGLLPIEKDRNVIFKMRSTSELNRSFQFPLQTPVKFRSVISP